MKYEKKGVFFLNFLGTSLSFTYVMYQEDLGSSPLHIAAVVPGNS